MRTAGKLVLTTPGDRDIVMTRLFAAPRPLVFEAMTQPGLLLQWLHGPEGWLLTECTFERRVGGRYRYLWRHADGRTMALGGRIVAFEPPIRYAATEEYEAAWYPGEAVTTADLEDRGETTALTLTVRHQSREARDAALGFPMETGLEAGYARLDALLAKPVVSAT